MSLYRNKYRIESSRLQGWDYSSPGYYFITVCTYKHMNLFGHITENEIHLNEYGEIVQDEWNISFIIRHELFPDEFVVMPNHFHGIVRLVDVEGENGNINDGMANVVETSGRTSLQKQQPPQLGPKSVSSFMAGVKSVITKRINKIRNTPGARVFQQRFHDHIIRNEQELNHIRQYIKTNPENWHMDKMNNDSKNMVI